MNLEDQLLNRSEIIPSRTDVLSMAREADLIYWRPNSTYSDGVWWMDAGEPGDELERFAALVSKQERGLGFNQGYKQAIKDCVVLLMIQHEMANGAHNYWHVAANLIQAEYGVQHDD